MLYNRQRKHFSLSSKACKDFSNLRGILFPVSCKENLCFWKERRGSLFQIILAIKICIICIAQNFCVAFFFNRIGVDPIVRKRDTLLPPDCFLKVCLKTFVLISIICSRIAKTLESFYLLDENLFTILTIFCDGFGLFQQTLNITSSFHPFDYCLFYSTHHPAVNSLLL